MKQGDDVEEDDRFRDTVISPIIPSNIWQSAAFPYNKVARKAAEVKL